MSRIFTTDGACSGNPGPGAYAICEWNEKNDLIYTKRKSFDNTTNNRMELQAILEVMKIAAAAPNEDYLILSDSAYAINMLKPGGWIESWSRNGWKNSKKQTVENLDIILELYKYRTKIFNICQLQKVSGHSGDVRNEITDAIAANNPTKLRKFILENNIKINIKKEI